MAEIINKCFEQYRDKHNGQSCIVFGTGPTVDEYPNKDMLIKLGSNEIIYKPYKMDYYFIGDKGDKKRGFESDPEAYRLYKPNMDYFYRCKGDTKFHCKCFVRGELKGTPYTYNGRLREVEPSDDIVKELNIYATISAELIQFAVFCGFSKIYLVGMDSDYSNGSFKSKDYRMDARTMRSIFSKIAKWLKSRNVECYSINPVGLTVFPTAGYEELI